MTFDQGRHRARVFRLYNTRTTGHRPLTTGPSGARHSALLTWIVSRASGVYSEHGGVVRIHPRYRGTPPNFEAPQKEMRHHTCQKMVMPAGVLAHFIVGHAQFGFRFLKTLFNGPPYAT